MKSKEAVFFCGRFDLPFEVRVPPDVINIGGDPDERVIESVAYLVGTGESIDRAPVIGKHGVKWIDSESDIKLFREGKDCGNPVRDLLARRFQRLSRDGTADENDEGSSERSGFANREAVVFDRSLDPVRI